MRSLNNVEIQAISGGDRVIPIQDLEEKGIVDLTVAGIGLLTTFSFMIKYNLKLEISSYIAGACAGIIGKCVGDAYFEMGYK